MRSQNKTLPVNQRMRTYYTDRIYEYPENYIHTKIYPRKPLYRECWEEPWWNERGRKFGNAALFGFWTYIGFMFCYDPGVVFGHGVNIDTRQAFTDEELGIPPDSLGLYEDWIKKKIEGQ